MTTLACGCKYEAERWTALCPPHEAEWKTRHQQAAADYKRGGPAPTTTDEDIDPWT